MFFAPPRSTRVCRRRVAEPWDSLGSPQTRQHQLQERGLHVHVVRHGRGRARPLGERHLAGGCLRDDLLDEGIFDPAGLAFGLGQ